MGTITLARQNGACRWYQLSVRFNKGFSLVGAAGFEPATTRTPSVCATRLRHAPTV
jgi:hypothetical protein